MMIEYRICKNKYGYYKIQQLTKPVRIFGVTIKKAKWVDACYIDNHHYVYDSRNEAQLKIDRSIEQAKKNNNEWTCE